MLGYFIKGLNSSYSTMKRLMKHSWQYEATNETDCASLLPLWHLDLFSHSVRCTQRLKRIYLSIVILILKNWKHLFVDEFENIMSGWVYLRPRQESRTCVWLWRKYLRVHGPITENTVTLQ